MRFYWSYKSLPELSALPEAERWAAWRRAHRQAYEHWQTWAGNLTLIPLVWGGWWLGSLVGHEEIGGIIGALISCAISTQVVFRMARSHLTQDGSSADRE
jgi:hypothetical protein